MEKLLFEQICCTYVWQVDYLSPALSYQPKKKISQPVYSGNGTLGI